MFSFKYFQCWPELVIIFPGMIRVSKLVNHLRILAVESFDIKPLRETLVIPSQARLLRTGQVNKFLAPSNFNSIVLMWGGILLLNEQSTAIKLAKTWEDLIKKNKVSEKSFEKEDRLVIKIILTMIVKRALCTIF